MRKFRFRKIKRIAKKIYHWFIPADKPKPFYHTYDVRDIFFQENVSTGFKRYDMIVRLLAIENYYGLNEYGWNLYERMQEAHLGVNEGMPAVERFRALIQSYEEKGYDENSAIVLDNRLMIWDGSHRMALAFYHHHYLINALVQPIAHDVDVSNTSFSFMKIGFTKEEENIIFDRYGQLTKECIRPFVVTLWKPIVKHYDKITYHLSKFGKIVSYHDVELTDFNYGSLMLKIYSCDDGTEDGIKQKILCQQGYRPNKLRFIYLNVYNPNYRIKGKTLNPISQTCERLKRNIRQTYKKYIPNYNEIHDGIIHIGDNYAQNTFIYDLVENYDKVPVREIFEAIAKYQYVVTKHDTPYMPLDFPRTYPLGKDADIICSEEDLEPITQAIMDILKKQNNEKWRIKFIKDATAHIYIYIYIYNQFVYGFDLCPNYVYKEFVKSALEHRVNKGDIYVTDDAHEMIVRLFEYQKSPNKKHHLEWIQSHYNTTRSELYNQFLSEDMKNTLKQLC